MTVAYLASFTGGLLLAVFIMIYGVERPVRGVAQERSFRLSPPVLFAFLTVFGAVGYIMTRRELLSGASRLATAAVAGLIAAAVAARLVRSWWTVTPEHDVDDERYILQGNLARVTKAVDAGVDGEVAFEISGERRIMRARSVDGTPLAAGTEVVIERIENDLAYVEAWAEVERRL
jgi:hypothetical protein